MFDIIYVRTIPILNDFENTKMGTRVNIRKSKFLNYVCIKSHVY